MADLKPVTIVGGGLAGLTLGIALRRQQVPVTVWEAGHYPRHRVCGEFISGRGQQSLARLELLPTLLEAGARWAQSSAFFAPGRPPIQQPLPQPALCLSRHILDDLLAREFRRAGGELREGARWSQSSYGAGVVRASGRRVQPVVHGWRWFGLKAHARHVALQADLEMHLFPDGYVGLCRLNEEVNVCGLFRSRTPLPGLAQHWREMLRGKPGPELYARLAEAGFDEESFCAVAGLDVESRRLGYEEECALGDALTMTPPVTGNGMSMAFEAAELAAGPLVLYSRGELAWDEARKQIAAGCRRQFASRLAFAGLLHRALFYSGAQRLLAPLLRRVPWLLPILFNRTR